MRIATGQNVSVNCQRKNEGHNFLVLSPSGLMQSSNLVKKVAPLPKRVQAVQYLARQLEVRRTCKDGVFIAGESLD